MTEIETNVLIKIAARVAKNYEQVAVLTGSSRREAFEDALQWFTEIHDLLSPEVEGVHPITDLPS